jgi:hypothetical protein
LLIESVVKQVIIHLIFNLTVNGKIAGRVTEQPAIICISLYG